jgi:hypothetical protein
MGSNFNHLQILFFERIFVAANMALRYQYNIARERQKKFWSKIFYVYMASNNIDSEYRNVFELLRWPETWKNSSVSRRFKLLVAEKVLWEG